MKHLIFGLFMSILGPSALAAGVDCPSRLTTAFTALIERGLDRGNLRAEDVVSILGADRPVNPMAGVTLDSTNSSFYRALDTHVKLATPESWAQEKENLRAVLVARDLLEETRTEARAYTRMLIRPNLTASEMLKTVDVKWVDVGQGRVWAIQKDADRLRVVELPGGREVWAEPEGRDARTLDDYYIGRNSAGHVEVSIGRRIQYEGKEKWKYYFHHPLTTGIYFRYEMYDLENGGVKTTRDEEAQPGDPRSRDPYLKSNAGDWSRKVHVQSNRMKMEVELPVSGDHVVCEVSPLSRARGDIAYQTRAGRVFVALPDCEDPVRFQFFEPTRSERKLFEYRLPETGNVQLNWFETRGRVVLIADVAEKGTYIFELDSERTSPVAVFHGEEYKDYFFKPLQHGDEDPILIGKIGAKLNFLNLFEVPR